MAFKVFLIDDEPDLLSSMRDLVEDSLENVEIETAKDGAQALEKLKSFKADLIITDLKMPNMEGNDLIAELFLNHKDLTPKYIFVVSGFIGVEAEYGVDNLSFFSKPLDIDSFIKKLKEVATGKWPCVKYVVLKD